MKRRRKVCDRRRKSLAFFDFPKNRSEELYMSTIEKSITVKKPVTTVYNQWTQFESFPKFMEGV